MAERNLVLADSHCHIDMPQFDADRSEVVARAREAGVEAMLLVGGVDEEAGHQRALRVAGELGYPASAGVHPHEARLWTAAVEDGLRGLARDKRIVAIGEIGLDFHYDHSPREAQRNAFRRQVRLARDVGLPVIIHTREADGETADLLEQEGAVETGGVIHCFTGGHELARRALALGFYVSFSGILAFPRAEVIQEVAQTVPLDRLLVETDAPFLAPPPHRGKRNEPAFVVEVARKVAALRGIPPEDVGRASLANFRTLFR
jgi:TatD DNase family protein